MSFLNTNNSEQISARITQKGRNAIAKGNFKIEYFQVGDSEFDYNLLFSGLTTNSKHQMVMTPFDKEAGVKYPYKIDSVSGSTTYGVPIEESTTDTIRNVMGPAGFVSNYLPYDNIELTGTTVKTNTEAISYSQIDGTNTITVASGTTYLNIDHITIVFDQFGGTDPENPVITGITSSMIYKILNVSGDTLTLDRNLPDLTALSGNVEIVCNYGDIENPSEPSLQQNPWTLNVVWTEKPIGVNNSGADSTISGYTSSGFISAKELLGYTTDAQTYTDITGSLIDYPTSYVNSYNEIINVESEEQRTIAIIHFSELGDVVEDPDRFFKYDDYISHDDEVSNSIITDENDIDLSDTEYFEIYIPFIIYHRNTGTTIGATFSMSDTDYYLNSTINDRHSLLFRYLLDEQGNKVGKIFPNNKIVVFDDQELVAILDYRSNRRYTLPAPKISTTPSDDIAANSLFSGTTGQTLWVTYALEFSSGSSSKNSLPCNYYGKIDSTTDLCNNLLSNVIVKFNSGSFSNLGTLSTSLSTGYSATRFYILAQETNSGEYPTSDSWKRMEYTTEAGGTGSSYITSANLEDTSFIITKSKFDSGSLFNLETFLGSGYTSTSATQFGDEQAFPGSIRLIRATDIEQMNFIVNLPSTQFLETQNPTYTSGSKYVTEIALLNSNKEPLIVGKTPLPINRIGTQNFSVRLDF